VLLKIQDLMDDSQCFDRLREMRWPEGRICSFCNGYRVIRRGLDDKHQEKQRYECNWCFGRLDDLIVTMFSGEN